MIENNIKNTSIQKIQEWRDYAEQIQLDANNKILGQEKAIKLIIISLFARGHVLLEGGVGVGKTTLLQIITKLIGGEYERVEGTVDMMPNDIIYHASINDEGKPHISNGPLLKKGEDLSIFFFNEINRARPQVHSLLLRIMAEKTLSAFNSEFKFPHLIVFADRNQVEKEETFEIPSAARDRFMMEIPIVIPQVDKLMTSLVFDTKFHDADKLIEGAKEKLFKFDGTVSINLSPSWNFVSNINLVMILSIGGMAIGISIINLSLAAEGISNVSSLST